jgi:hypothetical protein
VQTVTGVALIFEDLKLTARGKSAASIGVVRMIFFLPECRECQPSLIRMPFDIVCPIKLVVSVFPADQFLTKDAMSGYIL